MYVRSGVSININTINDFQTTDTSYTARAMDVNRLHESSSSDTVVLWRNNAFPVHAADVGGFPGQLYETPRALSENYLYLIRKTAVELVNAVVDDSEWIVQCSVKTNR